MEYPKIETVFVRNEQTHRVEPGNIRLPEFALISQWMFTEKIDGTNIRIHLLPSGEVRYGGRTDEAQLHASMVQWLSQRLPAEKVSAAFEALTEVYLFGEGYGPKIQKGGGNYRRDGVSFRLFDVVVVAPTNGRLWWLNWGNVEAVAAKLGVETVQVLEPRGVCSIRDAVSVLSGEGMESRVAKAEGTPGHPAEGIVARTDPLLLMRDGSRLMWKLKTRDLPKEGGEAHGAGQTKGQGQAEAEAEAEDERPGEVVA